MVKAKAKTGTAKKKSRPEDKILQSVINIGLVGHVDHGKTTLAEALTGKWTDTHSEEIKRGITIRLGYADVVFRKCEKCKGLEAYTTSEECGKCGGAARPLRRISFVDAPGHESLMATMLSGSALMDGALLLVAANEECPQPQTMEHFTALQIIGIKNVVIVQNKIDLVSEEQAKKNYTQIKEFIKGSEFEGSPIIPVSGQRRINIDLLIGAIEEHMPTPKRDMSKDALMYVARSFDVNKPGCDPFSINGGVLGGGIRQGGLKIGDKIEIRPGRRVERHGKVSWEPLTTEISGIRTGDTNLDEAFPGGSIGVMTTLDPGVVKADQLTGSVVGKPGTLPPLWEELALEVHLLERVVGARDKLVVSPIKPGESLMLNVNSSATVGIVKKLEKSEIALALKLPVCTEKGSRATISRNIGARWRLIGYGIVK